MVGEESAVASIVIIIFVALFIVSCGLLTVIGIDGIANMFWTRRSRAKSTWRLRVLDDERPLYSLKAFRALGGKLDNMDMPHIGRYYVMLSFRDWYKLRNENDKAKARHEREEREKRILNTRIEIANYCKEKAE